MSCPAWVARDDHHWKQRFGDGCQGGVRTILHRVNISVPGEENKTLYHSSTKKQPPKDRRHPDISSVEENRTPRNGRNKRLVVCINLNLWPWFELLSKRSRRITPQFHYSGEVTGSTCNGKISFHPSPERNSSFLSQDMNLDSSIFELLFCCAGLNTDSHNCMNC